MSETAKRPVDLLRERRGGMSAGLKAWVKEQGRVRKLLEGSLKGGAKTVPELAAATRLPSRDVLWHLMAMKKYGRIAEAERRGDYFAYALAGKE